MSSTNNKHYKCIEHPEKIKLLIIAEAPPKEDENYFYCLAKIDTDGRKRQFFHNLMKGVGLLEKETMWNMIDNWHDKENELLEAFFEKGCFLIDTSPEPLKGKNKKAKVKQMKECVPSLIKQIDELNPEKVLFIKNTTNTIIRNLVAREFPDGRILEEVLPYPIGECLEGFIKQFRDLWKKYFHEE